MASAKVLKPPHERRKGEAALSDFAEFVEQQQAIRFPSSRPTHTTTGTAAPASKTSASNESIDDELDDILNTLNLSDNAPQLPLHQLLLGPEDESVSKLADLISSRLEDGHGEAVFDLGFEQNGESMHLNKADWDKAWDRLQVVARKVNADCQLLLTKNVGGDVEGQVAANDKDKDCSGKILIRRNPATVESVIETRIAVVGNVDAGKSSMLGVLVKGDLDDGRGKARVNLFRHKHEIETGRTSSVGMEIMGFDTQGKTITSDVPGRKLSWEEIGKRSAKVITFTDLAGHERYLRTTVFGLLSSSPNYCLLMVAANNGLIGMSKEHLGIALALNVPVMVVITKIDICPPQILEQTITQITKILKSPGARKIPIFINNRDECINTATQFVSQRITPIFQVSNVTGQNLDLVRTFLNILPHHGRYIISLSGFHCSSLILTSHPDTMPMPHLNSTSMILSPFPSLELSCRALSSPASSTQGTTLLSVPIRWGTSHKLPSAPSSGNEYLSRRPQQANPPPSLSRKSDEKKYEREWWYYLNHSTVHPYPKCTTNSSPMS